jgi:hypothetical protein
MSGFCSYAFSFPPTACLLLGLFYASFIRRPLISSRPGLSKAIFTSSSCDRTCALRYPATWSQGFHGQDPLDNLGLHCFSTASSLTVTDSLYLSDDNARSIPLCSLPLLRLRLMSLFSLRLFSGFLSALSMSLSLATVGWPDSLK